MPSVPDGEGVISGGVEAAAGRAERFSRAYHALRADSSVQFNLPPPPKPPKPPAWLEKFFNWLGEMLKPVARVFRWIGDLFPSAPVARIVLWSVIALGAAALLWALYNRLRHGEWGLRLARRTEARDVPAEEEWRPEAAGARSWLEEADALAREGRFGEAIRHLLFRSIEDIANRRPALVRPALTSRELAASEGIPGKARDLFAGIARLVERSLFAGQPVGEKDWLQAREIYSNFALPAAWRA